MKIRRHVPADFEEIARLRWQLKTEGCPQYPAEQKRTFISAYLNHLRKMDETDSTAHWVVEHDDNLNAVATVRTVLKEPSITGECGRWGYLTNVFVCADFRNSGAGSKLLKAAIVWAGEHDFEFIQVWPSERSYPFYRRLGFQGNEDSLILHL